MAEEACVKKKRNLGSSKCNKLPSMFQTGFLTPLAFVIPAELPVETPTVEEYLQAAMIDPDPNKRIYLLPDFINNESNNEDPIYFETPLTDSKVRDGKYRWRFQISQDMCTHRALGTHNGANQRFMPYDIENQLFAQEKSNGDWQGFRLGLFNREKLQLSDGTNPTVTPIYVVLKNSKDVDDAGIVIDAPFVGDLIKLSDVTITPVAPQIATAVKVKVMTTCDGVPLLGLVVADFIFLDVAGAPQTITAVAYTSDGVYTLTGVGLESGTVTLVEPPDLSIKAYEAIAPATIVIP